MVQTKSMQIFAEDEKQRNYDSTVGFVKNLALDTGQGEYAWIGMDLLDDGESLDIKF